MASLNFISEPVPARLWSTAFSSLNKARFRVFQNEIFAVFQFVASLQRSANAEISNIFSLDESIQMFAPRPRSLKIRENDFTS